MNYYLWINETHSGPWEASEILKKLIDKIIPLETLACEEGVAPPRWIKVSEIPAIRSSSFVKKQEKIRVFQSYVGNYSTCIGQIYLVIGVIGSLITAAIYHPYIGACFLLGTFATAVFFMALGEIIRILSDIRSELKNQRAP